MTIGTLMEIEDCQVRGQVFTRFTTLDEKPLDGNTWSGGATRKQTTSRPDTVARDLERHVRCIETQRKAKVGFRKTEA